MAAVLRTFAPTSSQIGNVQIVGRSSAWDVGIGQTILERSADLDVVTGE
jgi:hypothetical protein